MAGQHGPALQELLAADLTPGVAFLQDLEGGRPVSFTLNDAIHRLHHVIGPERIAGIWWEGHNKTRDYYEVEASAGKRFWIFRVLQTARWFLHGRFE